MNVYYYRCMYMYMYNHVNGAYNICNKAAHCTRFSDDELYVVHSQYTVQLPFGITRFSMLSMQNRLHSPLCHAPVTAVRQSIILNVYRSRDSALHVYSQSRTSLLLKLVILVSNNEQDDSTISKSLVVCLRNDSIVV